MLLASQYGDSSMPAGWLPASFGRSRRARNRADHVEMSTLEQSAVQSREIKCTTCYMCACRCGINVHLEDGRIRYIEGNRAHPVNRGVICAKGAAGIMQQN